MVSGSPSAPGRYPPELLALPGVAFDVDISDPAERIEAYIGAYQCPASADGNVGFDDVLMRDHIRLVSATSTLEKTAVTFSLKGGPNLTNRLQSIHGGAVALIYDMCTTMCTAPLAKKGFWQFGGVSRNLSVTFMRPATLDMDIVVECEVLQMGARLATIRGQMRDRSTGNLLSVAEHNKASVTFGETQTRI